MTFFSLSRRSLNWHDNVVPSFVAIASPNEKKNSAKNVNYRRRCDVQSENIFFLLSLILRRLWSSLITNHFFPHPAAAAPEPNFFPRVIIRMRRTREREKEKIHSLKSVYFYCHRNEVLYMFHIDEMDFSHKKVKNSVIKVQKGRQHPCKNKVAPLM